MARLIGKIDDGGEKYKVVDNDISLTFDKVPLSLKAADIVATHSEIDAMLTELILSIMNNDLSGNVIGEIERELKITFEDKRALLAKLLNKSLVCEPKDGTANLFSDFFKEHNYTIKEFLKELQNCEKDRNSFAHKNIVRYMSQLDVKESYKDDPEFLKITGVEEKLGNNVDTLEENYKKYNEMIEKYNLLIDMLEQATDDIAKEMLSNEQR